MDDTAPTVTARDAATASSTAPRYVGPGPRLTAVLIDTVIFTAAALPVLLAVYGARVLDDYFGDGVWLLGYTDLLMVYVLPFVSVVGCWRYRGATPGKMIVSARIVDADTLAPVGTARLALRALGAVGSALALGLGFVGLFRDPRRQTWHDRLARTVVIHAD